MSNLKSIVKYILSFFKTKWNFDDYPLEIWYNKSYEKDEFKFRARFINWHSMIAFGDSVIDAKEKLREEFLEYVKNNKLPRPGSKVHFKFAESSRITQYEEIAIEFFDKIIGINYFECFVSDFSSLHDFELNDQETIEKIKSIYGIEPNSDLIILEIFVKIENTGSS